MQLQNNVISISKGRALLRTNTHKTRLIGRSAEAVSVKERWPKDREPKETAIEFLERVYKKFEGISRADIRRIDISLYNAISRHISRHGDKLPIELPSRNEVTEKAMALRNDEDSYERVKELERLAAAMRRRLVKGTARQRP